MSSALLLKPPLDRRMLSVAYSFAALSYSRCLTVQTLMGEGMSGLGLVAQCFSVVASVKVTVRKTDLHIEVVTEEWEEQHTYVVAPLGIEWPPLTSGSRGLENRSTAEESSRWCP